MFTESTDRPIRLRHQVLQSLGEHAEFDCLCHHAGAGREDCNNSGKVLRIGPAELWEGFTELARLLHVDKIRLWQLKTSPMYITSRSMKIHRQTFSFDRMSVNPRHKHNFDENSN